MLSSRLLFKNKLTTVASPSLPWWLVLNESRRLSGSSSFQSQLLELCFIGISTPCLEALRSLAGPPDTSRPKSCLVITWRPPSPRRVRFFKLLLPPRESELVLSFCINPIGSWTCLFKMIKLLSSSSSVQSSIGSKAHIPGVDCA